MSKKKTLFEYALLGIKKHPRLFEALAEYDQTRKLPKTVYRERLNITVNNEVLKRFKQYARVNGLNMSRVIEKHIKEELRSQ